MISFRLPDGIDIELLFPAVFGILALWNGVQAFLLYRGAAASQRWRPVDGIILTSRVTGHHSGNRVTFKPEIQYRYKAAGRTYEGTRIYFGAGRWRKDHLERSNDLVARYPEGARARIYVDPTRHDQAVLEQGVFDVARETVIWVAVFTTLCGIFTYAVLAA